MSSFNNESFLREIVAAVPLLLKKTPTDYFAVIGFREEAETRLAVPLAAGFSWTEQAGEDMEIAKECLMGMFHQISQTPIKDLVFITISEKQEVKEIAEMGSFVASVFGLAVHAHLRVSHIEEGQDIIGTVDGEDVHAVQIDPKEGTAYLMNEWPSSDDEFEAALRKHIFRED